VLSHDEIAERATPLPALGPDARAACGTDALVLACLHRAAHHRDSEELLWLYDIHLIACSLSDADWTAALTIVERGSVKAVARVDWPLRSIDSIPPVPVDITRQLERWRRDAVRGTLLRHL